MNSQPRDEKSRSLASSGHTDSTLPHQMANRLRTRLRQARAIVERNLGHSLTAIVPTSERPGHVLLHSTPRALRQSARSRMLSARAHSYSYGDFMPLLSATTSSSLGSRRSRPALIQRYQSAANTTTLLAQSAARQQQQQLRLSSSPSVPRTPLMQPLDSDNEVARTILMLATPPAARAPSLPESPRLPLTRVGRPAKCPTRRLSFSLCQAEPSSKRPRLGDNEEGPLLDPVAQTLEHASTTAPPQHHRASPRPRRHAPPS
ncbi:hypothetical protein IWW57_003144 [Coemansia sp. S610]|nr:hypothetical protein IWW57_003144 [Coemansia sp. S610]